MMYSLSPSNNVHPASCKHIFNKVLWRYHCNGGYLSPMYRALPLLLKTSASASSRSVQKRSLPRGDSQDETETYISPDDMSSETNTLVTEVMDIDRTPELLTWLLGSLLGTKQTDQPPPDSPSPASSASPQHPALPADASTSLHQPSSSLVSSPPSCQPNGTVSDTNPLNLTSSPSTVASQQQVTSSPPHQHPAEATIASTHTPNDGSTPLAYGDLTEVSEGASSQRMDELTQQSSAAVGAGLKEVAVVGSGCFWCIEAAFAELQGVVAATSGYAGGHLPNPTYQQVLTKTTGHAEVVRVEYDPNVLSYRDILQIFLSLHDPTTPNRSGPDVGPQYRSIILTTSPEQQQVAEQVLSEANRDRGWFARKVVTELAQLQAFYPAESYHQRYFARNQGARYCVLVVAPKLQEFRRKYFKRLQRNSAPAVESL